MDTLHWAELTNKRAAIEAQLAELHDRMSVVEMEWAMMVVLTNGWAQARDVTATINHEGTQRPTFARASQNVAMIDVLLDTLPAPTTDGVDKVYHQLKDIIDITTMQQAESSIRHRIEVLISSLS
jgi:hypothetical protein